MSILIAAPELITAAATDLRNIGSKLDAAKAVAVAPTTGLLAAGEDAVSPTGPTSRGASVWAADKPTVQSSLKSIRSTTRRRSRGRCAGGWGMQLTRHSESQPTRLRNRCCNPYKSCATT